MNSERRRKIISIVIATIMILSVAGFVLTAGFISPSSSADLSYHGFSFEQTQNGYQTTLNGKQYVFNNHPLYVDSFSLSNESSFLLKQSKVISISYDSSSQLNSDFAGAQFLLERFLQGEKKIVIRGLTNNSAFPQLSQIVCANATISNPVLLFEEGNVTELVSNNYCIQMNVVSPSDIGKLVDRIKFSILGIVS